VRIYAPYKFVSKAFRAGRHTGALNGLEIGGGEYCDGRVRARFESEKQILPRETRYCAGRPVPRAAVSGRR